MRSEFDEWYAKWTGSKVKCENTDIFGAWQHQQSKLDELQKRVDWLEDHLKAVEALSKMRGAVVGAYKSKDLNAETKRKFLILRKAEQALKGGSTPNLNTDENGECRHFSTTLFHEGKAECFHCDAVVNEKREVIGKQSKGLHPFFKKELP